MRRRGVTELLDQLRDLNWRMFAGEWDLAYTPTESKLHSVSIGDNPLGVTSNLQTVNPRAIVNLEEELYDEFVGNLRELRDRLYRHIRSARQAPAARQLHLNRARMKPDDVSWVCLLSSDSNF